MASSSPAIAPSQLDCGGRILKLTQPAIMGILNVTPDSFSDGGQFFDANHFNLDLALKRVEQMLLEGASIIDVGGESTRPGAQTIDAQAELDRVLPVVEAICTRFDVIVSIDTSTAEVMRACASAGAGIINDVRALARPGALVAAAETGLPVCLMHMQKQPDTMQNEPHYVDVVAEVYDFLQTRMKSAIQGGIPQHKILLDPGFGFGKTLEHNLELMGHLPRLSELGAPLLVGVSRKTMIGQLLGRPTEERLFGSIGAAVMALVQGAKIIRCHDVGATADAIRVANAMLSYRN